MFRLAISRCAATDAVARVALATLLAFSTAALFANPARAQSSAEPAVDALGQLNEAKSHISGCQHNQHNPYRYFFLYTNGEFDSGISEDFNVTPDSVTNGCITFQDGDTDLDAENLHLSCSVDYTADPDGGSQPLGGGLIVESWFIEWDNGKRCSDSGVVTIIKEVAAGSDTSQSFEFSGPDGASYSLKDGESESFLLGAGTYTVTELVPSGWDLTGLVCSDPTGNSTVDLGNAEATVVLDVDNSGEDPVGEDITCTFTNEEVEVEEATITIVKEVTVGSTSQEFGFTGDLGTFSLKHNESKSFIVAPGTFQVNETVPNGWTLDDADCDDAGSSDPRTGVTVADGDDVTCTFSNSRDQGTIIVKKETVPDEDPNTTEFGFTGPNGNTYNLTDDGQNSFTLFTGNYSVAETTVPNGWKLTSSSCSGDDDGTDPSNIVLDKGETVTCTFTNTQLGTIIVEKQTTPDGSGQSFSFTGDASGTITDGGQITVSDLEPGTYTSTESLPNGWELTSISCDDGNSSGNISTRQATFNLEAGETVKCTFNNREQGRIIVEKQTLPDGSNQLFSFTSDFVGDFDLGDGGTKGGGTFLTPGQYNVSETVPDGWELTGLDCDDGNSVENLGNASATVNLEAGETVRCIFTNTQDGTINIVKQTTPDASPKVFSFSGDLGGFSLSDGQTESQSHQPGNFSVSESVPFGWRLDTIVCDDSVTNNSSGSGNTADIMLEAGETVTCTFNNVELDAGIAVLKKTNGDESNSGSCVGVLDGSTVNWTYEVTNTGDVPVDITSIVDDSGTPGSGGDDLSLGAGISFVSGDTNGNGLLDTDETWTYSASGTGAFQGAGEYLNTVTVNGEAAEDQQVQAKVDLGDPVQASDSSCYITPGIQITKDDGGATVNEGESFAYTLSFQNTGGLPLTNVVISDTVPANTTFDSAGSTAGWSCSDGDGPGTLCTFNVGNLAVGGSGSVQFGLTVDDIVQPDPETGLCPEEPPAVVVNNTGEIDGDSGAGAVSDDDDDSTPVNLLCDPVLASLTVAKVTIPSGVQHPFDFTSPNSEIGNFTLSGHGDSKTFSDLVAGNYSVNETVPEGWALTGESCDNGDDPSSITLDPGDSVTCTFTNTQDGEITVVKQTDPDGSPQLFDFSGSLGNFQLSDGQSKSQGFQPGTYSVSESVPAGWELTSATCDDGSDPSSIGLSAGETVTCTFNNRELDANISLDKITNGIPDDFEGCNGVEQGSTVTWTYTVTNPGEQPIDITELLDDNGTPGDAGDDFGTGDGRITFVGGDTNGNGLLDPGESWEYTASGTAVLGEYINTATVTGAVAEEQQAAKLAIGTEVSDSDQSRYCGEGEVDLAIQKDDGGLLFVPEGTSFAYTLSYQNLGDLDVTGVVITETVPVNTTFDNSGPDAGLWNCSGTAAGSTCTHNVGALAAGASGSVQFPLLVDELVEPDPETGECPTETPNFQVDNTGSIADDGENGADVNPSNNTDSDDTPILTECEPEQQTPPEININKDPPSQLIQEGEDALFTITVTNTGPVKLINVVVDDPQAQDCNRNIGDMEPAAVVSYSCKRAHVVTSFTNTATVTGEDEAGNDVSDEDSALVNVLNVDEPELMHPIPTLSQWALILMAGLMLLLGRRRVREWTRR